MFGDVWGRGRREEWLMLNGIGARFMMIELDYGFLKAVYILHFTRFIHICCIYNVDRGLIYREPYARDSYVVSRWYVDQAF